MKRVSRPAGAGSVFGAPDSAAGRAIPLALLQNQVPPSPPRANSARLSQAFLRALQGMPMPPTVRSGLFRRHVPLGDQLIGDSLRPFGRILLAK